MAVLKHIEIYQQTKTAADYLKTAKNKDAYRCSHKSEIVLHEAATRAIKAVYPDGGKLPKLKTEYARLFKTQRHTRGRLCQAEKQARGIGVIKSNVDSILDTAENKGRINRQKEL